MSGKKAIDRWMRGPHRFGWGVALAERWFATRERDAITIQRDDLYERLGRIRAAALSDPDLPSALRSFLLVEASEGWLHVTDEIIERLRSTGTHHAATRQEERV